MGRAGDVLSIVEASYADAGSEREWLRALVEAATPVLDTGIGISATSFVHRGSTVEYRESVWTGPLAEFVSLERMHDAVEAQSKCLSREAFARLYPSRPEAATFRRLARRSSDVCSPRRPPLWTPSASLGATPLVSEPC
jgi:hypothetical protein